MFGEIVIVAVLMLIVLVISAWQAQKDTWYTLADYFVAIGYVYVICRFLNFLRKKAHKIGE